jgi:hypothetical protein
MEHTMNKRVLMAMALCSALGVLAQTGSRSMPVPIVVTVQRGNIAVSDGQFRATSTVTSWSIATAGYVFAQDGIDFGNAQDQFSCSTTNGGLGMRCTRSAGSTGRFPYTIRLVNQTAGQTVESTDPTIVWVNSD